MTTSHTPNLRTDTGLGSIVPTSPSTARDARLTAHSSYYFSSGDIIVVVCLFLRAEVTMTDYRSAHQVDRMRYRVHACLLAPHSEMFSELIQNDGSSTAPPEAYITLRRTSTIEFEAFLALVYPA